MGGATGRAGATAPPDRPATGPEAAADPACSEASAAQGTPPPAAGPEAAGPSTAPADGRAPTPTTLSEQETALLVRLEPVPEQPIPLGDYLLLGRVADGGMAEIFVATPARGGAESSLVAIKRMLPHLAANPQNVRLFEEEARIAARLAHPNVVAIREQQRDEWGVPFIVMEFLPGATLKGVIRASLARGEMPPIPFSVWVVTRVCRALHHAHALGVDGDPVVHGDISPENVLITYGGQVKLLDFGTARAAGKRGLQEAESLQGKLSYMAPEQAFRRAIGPWTDQFALGVVLFELVTGRRLYRQHRTLESLQRAFRRPVPHPRAINPQIPEALDTIVSRLCALEPAKRYPDCKEVLAALDRFLVDCGLFLGEEDIARYMQNLFAEDFLAYREWLRRMVPGQRLQPDERSMASPFQARRALSLSDTAEFYTGEEEVKAPSPLPSRLRRALPLVSTLGSLLLLTFGFVLLGRWCGTGPVEDHVPVAPAVRPLPGAPGGSGAVELHTPAPAPLAPPSVSATSALPTLTPETAAAMSEEPAAVPATPESLPRPPAALPPPPAAVPAAPAVLPVLSRPLPAPQVEPAFPPAPPAPAADAPATTAPERPAPAPVELAATPAPPSPVPPGPAPAPPVNVPAAPAPAPAVLATAPAAKPPAPGSAPAAATPAAPDVSPTAPGDTAPRPGILSLVTDPPAAVMVWEGGQVLGVTPLEKALPPGLHTLELKDLGGRLLQRIEVRMQADTTLMRKVKLDPER